MAVMLIPDLYRLANGKVMTVIALKKILLIILWQVLNTKEFHTLIPY